MTSSSRLIYQHVLRLAIILLILLAGCAPAAPAPQPTTTRLPAAPTPLPSATPLPSQTPSAIPTASRCVETGTRVEPGFIDSQLLPKPLQVRVVLPPCYSDHPGRPYPVLILLHGQSSSGDQWQRLGLPEAAARMMATGALPPFLIVLPTEEDTLANPYESAYGKALVEELLPWLERSYPACRERSCRAIGGLSRGAAWAMTLGLQYPDLFGAIGAHSLAPFYGDFTWLPYRVRDIPAGQTPAIWMDSGERDRYLSQARRYHELLDQYQVPHEWHLLAGEHDEAYWQKNVEAYLRWYGTRLQTSGRHQGVQAIK